RQGLSETGYVESQNVKTEYRWGDGQNDRLPALAADLVRSQVAVIVVAGGTAAAQSAKAATGVIPIVFLIGGDPQEAGLVASLGRPSGNVTGVAELSEPLITKRLDLMRELVPGASVIGFLLNSANPNVKFRSRDIHEAARLTHTQVRIVSAMKEEQFDAAFSSAVRQG